MSTHSAGEKAKLIGRRGENGGGEENLQEIAAISLQVEMIVL